jgi:hypothetical protein
MVNTLPCYWGDFLGCTVHIYRCWQAVVRQSSESRQAAIRQVVGSSQAVTLVCPSIAASPMATSILIVWPKSRQKSNIAAADLAFRVGKTGSLGYHFGKRKACYNTLYDSTPRPQRSCFAHPT